MLVFSLFYLFENFVMKRKKEIESESHHSRGFLNMPSSFLLPLNFAQTVAWTRKGFSLCLHLLIL